MNRLINVRKVKTEDGLRYYKHIKYPSIPLNLNDLYVTTTDGDRLDLLANQFYRNTEHWWIIATANMDIIKRDSFALKPGLEIRIPTNVNKILKDFEKLNDKLGTKY